VFVVMLAPVASAIPELQLYIEGATYDELTETWIHTVGSDPFRLWAIGNVGAKGPITDVRLAAAYSSTVSPTISFTGSTTGGLGGFSDPSTAAAPTYLQTVTDGSVPQLSDGSDLAPHGVYGAGTYWQEFLLGDFVLEDSPIADFIGEFPDPHDHKMGQINVYEVSLTGLGDEDFVHFDLYNSYYNEQAGQAKAVFAPFSHDAGVVVPEPGTLALIGLGMAGLGARLRRKLK
jgi:hypothetical protein